MSEVSIVPGILICSGAKVEGRYKNPFVKIISPPNGKLAVKVGWDDNVKISVPIVYHESTSLKDRPRFAMDVTNEIGGDGSYGFRKSKSYTGKDAKGRYNGFKKALRIKIPQPTTLPDDSEYIPDQIILPTDTFLCNFYVGLEIKEWSDIPVEFPDIPYKEILEKVGIIVKLSEDKHTAEMEKEASVEVTIERRKNYVVECPRCHSKLPGAVVLGIPDQSELAYLLKFLHDKKMREHWEQMLYEREFGRVLKVPDDVNTISEFLAWNFSKSLGIPRETAEDVIDWANYIISAITFAI